MSDQSYIQFEQERGRRSRKALFAHLPQLIDGATTRERLDAFLELTKAQGDLEQLPTGMALPWASEAERQSKVIHYMASHGLTSHNVIRRLVNEGVSELRTET